MSEKTVEIIADDLGNVTIAVRPPFRSAPDDFSVDGDGGVVSIHFGNGLHLDLDVEVDSRAALARADQILVSEFSDTSDPPVRETDIMRKSISDFPV